MSYKNAKVLRRNRIEAGLCTLCIQETDRPGKKLCTNCLEKQREPRRAYQQRYQQILREAAFSHYGQVCQCCGETCKPFLCFDHIENNGGVMRKADPTALNLSNWLRRHNYPVGFQTLCHNCNYAKAVYSVCPHKQLSGIVYPRGRLRHDAPRVHKKRIKPCA